MRADAIACETRIAHSSAVSRARALIRCEECACRKGTNSQISADDGSPAIRGVVAKLDRGTNESRFRERYISRKVKRNEIEK